MPLATPLACKYLTMLARLRDTNADVKVGLGFDTDCVAGGLDNHTLMAQIAWSGGPITMAFPWLYQQRLGLTDDQMCMYVALVGCDGACGYPRMGGVKARNLLLSNNITSVQQLMTTLETMPDGLAPAAHESIMFTYLHRRHGMYLDAAGNVQPYTALPPGLGPLSTEHPSNSELDGVADVLPLPHGLSQQQRRAAAEKLANLLWLPVDQQPAAVARANTLLGSSAVALLPEILRPLAGLSLRALASSPAASERIISSVLFFQEQQAMAFAAAIRQLGAHKFLSCFPSDAYLDEVRATVQQLADSTTTPQALRTAAQLAAGRTTAISIMNRIWELIRLNTEVATVAKQEFGWVPYGFGAQQWWRDLISMVADMADDAVARGQAHELLEGNGPLRWYTLGGEAFLLPRTWWTQQSSWSGSTLAAWSTRQQYELSSSCYCLSTQPNAHALRINGLHYDVERGMQAAGSPFQKEMVAVVRRITTALVAAVQVKQQQLIAQGDITGAAAMAMQLDPDAPLPQSAEQVAARSAHNAAWSHARLQKAHGKNLLLLGDMAQASSCVTHTAASGDDDGSAATRLAQLAAILPGSAAAATVRWGAISGALRGPLQVVQQQASIAGATAYDTPEASKISVRFYDVSVDILVFDSRRLLRHAQCVLFTQYFL